METTKFPAASLLDTQVPLELTKQLFSHPETQHFDQLYTRTSPTPIFLHLSSLFPQLTNNLTYVKPTDSPLYHFHDLSDYLPQIHLQRDIYHQYTFPSSSLSSIITTTTTPAAITDSLQDPTAPSSQIDPSHFLTNPFLFLQYKHILTKYWFSPGIIHLDHFHLNLNLFFGINCARYLLPSDNYDKSTFGIKFAPEIYEHYQFLQSPYHDPPLPTPSLLPTNSTSPLDDKSIQVEMTSHHPNQHKVLQFSPHHVFSILSYLYQTKTMSPLLQHYLTYVISIPSFINLVSAIISPHFDFIIPLALPFLPSPALFHAIFSTCSFLHNDLLVLLRPIYQFLFSIPSTTTDTSPITKIQQLPLQTQVPQINLSKINQHPFPLAQPSPHPTSPLSLIPATCISTHCDTETSINNHLPNRQNLRPQSLLINTILDDGSMNVFRITNGLK